MLDFLKDLILGLILFAITWELAILHDKVEKLTPPTCERLR